MGNVGDKFNGFSTNNIFSDAVDEDLKALYPSIILAFATESETLIGVLVDEEGKYTLLGEMMIEGDLVRVCNQFLGMPSFNDYLENIDDFLI